MPEELITQLGVGGMLVYMFLRDLIPKLLELKAKKSGGSENIHNPNFTSMDVKLNDITSEIRKTNKSLDKYISDSRVHERDELEYWTKSTVLLDQLVKSK